MQTSTLVRTLALVFVLGRMGAAVAQPAPADNTSALDKAYAEYQAFKDSLQNGYHLQYSMPVTIFPQWGTPNGGPGVVQLVYTPSISWTPFNNTAIGSGSFTFSFQQYQFWTKANTASQQLSMGLITSPSPQTSNLYEFSQITYTHTLPGDLNWLSVTVGQYGFSDYDANQYAGSAQSNFINYALSQNGTQAYANAGLGAFIQAKTPDKQFTFAGGFQDATDITGYTVTTRGYSTGKYAYFLNAEWTPSFLAGGSYGILWYSQPSVPQQPTNVQGVSLSAVQNITNAWGLFLRVNNASGTAIPIETSVSWGGIYNNPFSRNGMDQAGLGFFWSKTNLSFTGQPARSGEWGTEVYYNYTIFKGLQVTPDVQLYTHPALSPSANAAAVFTLRSTAFF